MKPAWAATATRATATPKPRKSNVAGPTDATGLRARARDVAPQPPPQAAPAAPEWQATYLETLAANGGQKTAACTAAGIVMSTLARRRQSNSAFEAAEVAALKQARDVVESEAIRRAVDGVESKTTTRTKDGTEYVTVERKYSDTIILRLLERLETGSWRQKQQVEHSGGMTFKTRAERKAALEAARASLQQPVEALNGRS